MISQANALGGNETDFLSLQAFKSRILHDPYSTTSSWNNSTHFCQWAGITCTNKSQRVLVINLTDKGLSGSLSPHLGNLSFLQVLKLGNNTFKGNIPYQLGNLLRLQILNLNNNLLQGQIPPNLSQCLNLTYLNLAYNSLMGKLPQELTSLSNLTDLIIHDNNFTGGFPPFIGNLTSLQTISASSNPFGGTLPDIFGRMKNLVALGLGGTGIFGTLPPSIYNISSINILSLPGNNLSGKLLPNLGLMLPNLQFLQLGSNQFDGPIPSSLSNVSGLVRLDMTNNSFSGKLSIDFSRMKSFYGMVMWNNNLGSGEPDEMQFIVSLANCTDLQVLGFQDNQFKGALPSYVGNFSQKLYHFAISGNQLYGEIPPWIGDLTGLTLLSLRNNELTGSIPLNIGNLYKVQRLTLSSNQLTGSIPPSIGNLTLLNDLYLHENRFEGTIPSSLGNCQQLTWLYIQDNNLSGTIPKELFGIPSLSITLSLARNRLFGSLPDEVGKLVHLAQIDVSDNELSGEIPRSIGSCTSLQNLYLQGNFFRGSIPSSLASLKGIQNLDLSRNNLSGRIPEFLGEFSISNLNLSFNNFEGEVPTKGVFANFNSTLVSGNRRLCGGISELKLPKCTILKPKKHKKLLKIILIAASATSILVGLLVLLILCWFKRRKDRKNVQESLPGETFPKLSYEQILKATNGFSPSNLVGTGGFGTVYRAVLNDDEMVFAVKVVNLNRRGASKSFIAECEALRNVRHRNLVKIYTCCSSIDFQGNEFKALVYEFMPNGSLESWLHGNLTANTAAGELPKLTLLQRIRVAFDVASALEYLHRHCQTPVIHCDLKPNNILLDNDMVAHVGDFGLMVMEPNQHGSSIGIRGTIGYAPPEYGVGGEVSTYGDVYSYGILLLEMVTGKKPTDPMFGEDINLHNYAKMSFPDRILEIVDPMLLQDMKEDDTKCLASMINIGVKCSMDTTRDRMDIGDVVDELSLILKDRESTSSR
ncbi:probable LRR receptor-like serine/threonine-protein kinase At3g47570 [Impatiens glandulifera]|uniref:probable LRR receptor-like serine/threonine-protein kinase At3g47570 n=1 Tax=Impatiens glandulifera TaxID=253017 RepID=UPI001FB13BE3|nr:probable LRR receptor-like serine/threonine-protein kinase At3g47570 [Impatiens glandulifera]